MCADCDALDGSVLGTAVSLFWGMLSFAAKPNTCLETHIPDTYTPLTQVWHAE